jgi:integrase
MWLCAYSGARAGEITQLRGADVYQRSGFYVMNLTPDAGTIKTRTAREVPLHEHIINQGFIDFVEQQGRGPLFYNAQKPPAASQDVLKPSRSLAQTTRAHLGEWVREIGVDDPDVSPTHGWRQTFQYVADEIGMPEKISDAIAGHAPPNVARRYAPPPVERLAKALQKFPRYDAGGRSNADRTRGPRKKARRCN